MDEETKTGPKYPLVMTLCCTFVDKTETDPPPSPPKTGYLNLRILLFGSILLTSNNRERETIPGSYDGIQKCLDSAKKTIEIIYETYKYHEFFRTWLVSVPMSAMIPLSCLNKLDYSSRRKLLTDLIFSNIGSITQHIPSLPPP